MMKEKGRFLRLPGILAVPVLLLWFFAAMKGVEAGSSEQGRQQLETALRRSAVACYASEGIYPPNVEYLKKHYGVQIDESRYTVFYEIFAENLMPDITVLEKGS